MTAAIVVLLSLAVIGLPMAMRLDRDARGGGLIGLGFLLAASCAAIVMLLMSLVQWPWSMAAVVAVLIALSIGAFLSLRSLPGRMPERQDPLPTVLSLILDGATVFCIIGHALYATVTAPWAWDFWAIWGMKGRIFLLRGGIDWEWLGRPFNDFSHPDYPPLLPLLFDFMMLADGVWNDRWIGVLYVAFVLAGVGVIRDLLLRGTGDRNLTSAGALLAAGTLLSPWVGLAEIPLITFTATALLYFRHAEKTGDTALLWCGSLLLGFGALTKNEGLAFAISAAAAVAVAFRFDRRALWKLWPALLLAGGWQVIRMARGLENDLFVGDVGERTATKLENVDNVFAALIARPPDRHLFWILILTIVFLGFRHVVRHERLLGVAIAAQLCFYVGSYVVTPHDVLWHVSTSWSRLADQLALPLSMLALFVLFRKVEAPLGEEGTHAAR